MIKVYTTTKALTADILALKAQGKIVGFVPTMGALHKGHLSLIEKCKANSDVIVASIFVNPTQFDNKTDLVKYPDTTRKDITMLNAAGTNILYLPTSKEVYPNGMQPTESFDFGKVTEVAEGAFRPGHFDGVAQVVGLLLDYVQPNKLFMGMKDFQQCAVIDQLIELRNMDIELVRCKTMREPDGLAMSSRNMRLRKDERKSATILSKALQHVKNNFKKEKIETLLSNAIKMIDETPHCKTVYIEVRHSKNMEKITDNSIEKDAVVLGAATVGSVRLIDNMLLF